MPRSDFFDNDLSIEVQQELLNIFFQCLLILKLVSLITEDRKDIIPQLSFQSGII